MSRSNVRVRPAEPDDIDQLVALTGEYHEVIAGRARRPARPDGVDGGARARLRRLLDDREHRLVVAVDDGSGELLGMAILGVDIASVVLDLPSVLVSHLLVAARHRRRGAGRALVAAAVGYAEDRGLEHVVVGVSSAGREANRFFARLGFAPLVLRRIAPVAALRRSLALGEAGGDGRPHAMRRRPSRAGLGLARPRLRGLG